MDWKKVVQEVNRNVGDRYDNSVENVLERLGLEQKRSTMEILFPMLGVFGAGIAVGATLGVLFAPKPGDTLRHEIRESLDELKERTIEKSSAITSDVKETAAGNSGGEASIG